MADQQGRVKRLFVAVDLDAATRAQVARVAQDARRLYSTGLRMTWVDPDRLHLTLEFFGSADAAFEETARSALARPFSLPPFALTLDGLGLFPPKGPPRVLWFGIARGMTELRRLRQQIQERLGERPGRREVFHPHLTLARFREPAPREAGPKLLEIKASAGPCVIDRVTLYQSRLSPKGPTYSALAEAALVAMPPCT